MGRLAALDPRRQLPGGASTLPTPASDGPGRAVVLVPIKGTVQRVVKWDCQGLEGVWRLRQVALVADIAPGAEWATLWPAAGTDPDRPPRPRSLQRGLVALVVLLLNCD